MAEVNVDDYELYRGMLFPKGSSKEDRDRYIEGQQHAESYQQQIASSGEMPLVDKVSRTLQNIPASGEKMAMGLYEAVTSPIETGDQILNLGGGALQLGLEALGIPVPQDEIGTQNKELARKVGEFFVNRYGSLEAAEKTLIEDPVGAAADAASVLMAGGGLTRMAGSATGLPAVQKAGEITSKVGRNIDPITGAVRVPVKGAQLAGRGVGEAAAGIIGMQTGTGALPLKEAYASGVEGGKRAESFRESMRGKGDIHAVVEDAAAAIDQIKDRAMTAYRSDKKLLEGDKTELSFYDIDKALDKSEKMAMSGDLVKRPNVKKYVDEAKAAIEEWRAGDPAVNHTAVGFDDLKQRIMDIYEGIPNEARTAQAAILEIKRQIQKTISAQAPGYAKMMSDYSKAMDELTEVRKALSQPQGGKASAETKLKKLQSVMRDNVNTGYGSRAEAVAKLDKEGANIVPRIAGQALESWTPRGIQTSTTLPMATMSGAILHPGLFPAQLASSSPRLMGELAHLTGKMARPIDRLSKIAGKPLSAMDQPELMQLLYQMTREEGDL